MCVDVCVCECVCECVCVSYPPVNMTLVKPSVKGIERDPPIKPDPV